MDEPSLELADARLQAAAVIGDQEEARLVVSLGDVSGWDVVAAFLRKQVEPLVEAPLVEKRGLFEQEVFDLLARDLLGC